MILLFVEDDSDDIELTLRGFQMERFEHEVVVARDGRDALDRLHSDYTTSRALPGAILTDLKMPRMDGLELLRRVKEDPRLTRIPVLFLTSSGDASDHAEALRLGASHYLRKPSALRGYADIVSRVRDIMGTTAPSGPR